MTSSDAMEQEDIEARTSRVLEAAIEKASPPIAGVLKFFRFTRSACHVA